MEEGEVRAWISDYIAEILGTDSSEVNPDGSFADYGLDSADAIIIGGALEDRFDVEVDAALFLRNETINALIEDLRRSSLLV